MQTQTLLIVLVLGCSPSWLGCNSIQQEQPIVEEETPQAACATETSFTLLSEPDLGTTAQPEAKPLFFNDILNVFNKREYHCSRCHGDQYQNPDEVKRKWVRVYAALESGFMPRGASQVTPEDLALLRNWQQAGFPATPADLQPQPNPDSRPACD